MPDGFFDEEELGALAELRPEGEAGLVVARRVFGDGRTRAYAWGRAVAREDVAAAAERLIAMSGQFEQRRLGRPSFQLDVLDAFCGPAQEERRRAAALAWRELVAARRRHDELTRDADAAAARLAELEALVDATEGMGPSEEAELLARRERLRHVEELAEAASAAASAIAPEEGEGAASLAARRRACARTARADRAGAHRLGRGAPRSRGPAGRGREAISTGSWHRSTRSRARSSTSRRGCRRSRTSSGGSRPSRTRRCWRPRPPLRASSARRTARTRSRRPRTRCRTAEAAMSTLADGLHSERTARATAFGEAVARGARVTGDGGGRAPRRAPRARTRDDRRATR